MRVLVQVNIFFTVELQPVIIVAIFYMNFIINPLLFNKTYVTGLKASQICYTGQFGHKQILNRS